MKTRLKKRLTIARATTGLILVSISCVSLAVDPPSIHIVYLGGPDCPPCVAWRATELPKLEKTTAFQSVKFT